MVQTVGDHSQGECLHARDGFIPVSAVAHHPRQSRHLGQPAAILLPFKFDREGHPRKVARPQDRRGNSETVSRG